MLLGPFGSSIRRDCSNRELNFEDTMVARQIGGARALRPTRPLLALPDGGVRALWERWQRWVIGRSREQRLLEVLARDGEPLVVAWARANRERVRDSEDLLRALERLQARASPEARSLAATIWLAWRDLSA
jgi:hypothetical protein